MNYSLFMTTHQLKYSAQIQTLAALQNY